MFNEQENLQSSSNKEQIRSTLLNDPNFGTVLSFLEKFRSVLDLPVYFYERLENHLVETENRVPPRLIDFHFVLLKRLSLAKNSQREKFDSIVSKFASRFDWNDSEQITNNGYLKSPVELKLRILKNLLESQFDLNQTFKNGLVDKSARELKMTPFGRDRFGVSYWLFMDDECYLRLFREDVDSDRSWSLMAKTRDELESFVKILFGDRKLRNKYSEWKLNEEKFDSVQISDEFEERFAVKTEQVEPESPKKKRGRPSRKLPAEVEVKKEEEKIEVIKEEEKVEVRTRSQNRCSNKVEEEKVEPKKKRGRPRRSSPNLKVESEENSSNVRRSLRNRKSSKIESCSSKTSSSNVKKRKSSKIDKSESATSTRKRGPKKIRDDRHGWTSSSSTDDENLDFLDDEDDEQFLFDEQENDELFESNFDQENLFQLEQEQSPDEELCRSAKTAQTSTVVTSCQVCSKSDRPEVLLLCDDCDDAFHIDCLRPELLAVPDGDWFCPFCEQKKLVEHFVERIRFFIENFHKIQVRNEKRLEKRNFDRKTKIKEYSSDETLTETETEPMEENQQNQENLLHDESTVSTNQINENSNYSSSNVDEINKNISQRGRHRRTRFDMNKMLNDSDQSQDESESETDDEYTEPPPQITNFDLQIPKKMTRLLQFKAKPSPKLELPTLKPRPIRARPSDSTIDLNENLGSPLIYVNGDVGNARPMKSVVTNSKQTLKIVRRWNDVQRRSRLKINSNRSNNETTSDCADENGVFCPEDSSPPRSNENPLNQDNKDDDSTIIRSKITLVQPVNVLPVYKSSTKNFVRKADANFDRLTRDIQFAVTEANNLSKINDQQETKRTQRTNFSPYLSKVSIRPLPVLLPKPTTLGYKIFKSKDPIPNGTNNNDLSNIILTTSSSIVDNND